MLEIQDEALVGMPGAQMVCRFATTPDDAKKVVLEAVARLKMRRIAYELKLFNQHRVDPFGR